MLAAIVLSLRRPEDTGPKYKFIGEGNYARHYSLVVFVPATHSAAVRAALAAAGAGAIGNYDSCSFTSAPGVGRFRPLAGARPALGAVGALEEVLEERIETEVLGKRLQGALAAARAAHPYETPAIHVSGPLLLTPQDIAAALAAE